MLPGMTYGVEYACAHDTRTEKEAWIRKIGASA